MTAAGNTFEERLRRSEQLAAALRWFMVHGPVDPLVTRAQVLEIDCRFCGAPPGTECDTRFPRPALFAGMCLHGMSGVHMRRYQDRSHDPR